MAINRGGGSRRSLALILGSVLALVAVIVAVPKIYSALQPPVKAPLTMPTKEGDSSRVAPAPQSAGVVPDLAGIWRVGPGSQAGYRVKEVLNGADVTVVGRTEEVRGSATIAGGKVTAGTIDVGVASLTTGNGARDSYFRGKVMNVAAHPNATFTMKTPIDLPEVQAGGVKIAASGSLQLAGTVRQVPVGLTVAWQGSGSVAVSGTIEIKASDFGLTAPSLGFVSVEDDVVVEFLVRLEK